MTTAFIDRWRRATTGCLLGLFAGLGWGVVAAPSLPQLEPVRAGESFYLQYREVDEALANYGLSYTLKDKPFPKEPKLSSGKILRGTLDFWSDPTCAVPFIWDTAEAKLYLDRNRNQDFTEDADAVLKSSSNNSYGFYHNFPRVELTFPTAQGVHRLAVSINLYSYGAGQFFGSMACHSFWEGRATLAGKDWQVGLVEFTVDKSVKLSSPAGWHLILRPWASRQRPLELEGGFQDGIPFTPKVFLDPQGYEVKGELSQQNQKPAYRLQFTECPTELGEVKLTGKSLQRLVLYGGETSSPWAVVLDTPPSTVKIPVGAYHSYNVFLKEGQTEAFRQMAGVAPSERSWLTVSASNAVPFVAGGPLTNTVTVKRQGRFLSLSYSVQGADGEPYQIRPENRSQPPLYAIYKGGKQVASGNFAYG